MIFAICPRRSPHVDSVAIRSILVLDRDRAGAANQDSDVGDRDTFGVDENEVCGPGIQWLEYDRPVVAGMNGDDIRIADQDGFGGSLVPEGRPGTEPEGDRLIRGPRCGSSDQQQGQNSGEQACKVGGHCDSSDAKPPTCSGETPPQDRPMAGFRPMQATNVTSG